MTKMRTWLICSTAALLFLVGCQKSADNSDQTAASGNATGVGPAGALNSSARRAEKERPKKVVVPVGSSIAVVLSSTISSKVNKPGEEFEGSVAEPVVIAGETAIPKGATAKVVVADAKKQGTFKGEAILAVRLTSVQVHGKDYEVETSPFSGTQKGKGKRTAEITGGGAAVGALIGGLAGGGKGAAIGAAAGGGGGLAASGATGGKNVEFPAESTLTFTLTQELTIER
jgi:hypothetical protein